MPIPEERIDLLVEQLSMCLPALIAGDTEREEFDVGCGTPYEYIGERKGNEVIITIKVA